MIDDMFSSSKGPGVIGMVLALIVFAGFLGLGVAVFDGRYNGDNSRSIESKLGQQKEEISFLNGRIVTLDKNLEKKRKNRTLRTELDVIKDRLRGLVDTQKKVEEEVAEEIARIEAVETAKSTYRQGYRDAVRAKAVGTIIKELKTLDGKVFQSVKIRKVTALELNFMEDSGPKSIPYENLPLNMQDYYQFDEEEAALARDERIAVQNKVSDRLTKVDNQKRAKKMDWEKQKAEEERIRAEQRIAKLQRKVDDARTQIEQEQGKADFARQQHELARRRGNTSAHLVTARKADEAAARWQKAITEANRLIAIERTKLK